MSNTLEEFRNEWADHSRRLEEHLRLSSQSLRHERIEREFERVRNGGPFNKFRMAVWVTTMVLLSVFLGTHARQPALFFSALTLDAWVIATGIAQFRQQRALRNLDFGLPLLELQARLESLRFARIRAFSFAFLTGQIVWWIPFVVVVAGAFGANLYSSSQFRLFAAWNISGGIALIPLAVWLARRFGGRLSRYSMARRIADSIAGRDIADARDALEKLRRFGIDTE